MAPRPKTSNTPVPSIWAKVDAEIDAIDKLAAELARGIRGPAHFDELEQQATKIGERLRAAFRAGRVAHD